MIDWRPGGILCSIIDSLAFGIVEHSAENDDCGGFEPGLVQDGCNRKTGIAGIHHILDIRRQSIVVCYANHILLAAVNHKNRNPQQFGVLLRQPLFRSAPNNAKKE